MTEENLSTVSRRSILKTGAIGFAGTMVVASPASANNGKGKNSDEKDKGNDYGNGNGVGAFLNEQAAWNDDPWNGKIVNKKGASSIEIAVGAFTTINPPPGNPVSGPFAFDPQAVLISPETDVTWTWVDHPNLEHIPHHSVTSYNEDADDPTDPTTTGNHGQLFDEHGNAGHTFTHTFEERGAHLYFCHPHGTPYPAYDAFLDDDPPYDPDDPGGDQEALRENLLGMRGAVLVRGN